MGLFDKIKDLFMDEVIDDEEMELEEENKKIYEEPKDVLPKVMRDNISREEKGINFEELKSLKDENKITEDSVVEKKFSFPIDFEDEVAPSRVASRVTANKEIEEVRREIPKREVPKKEILKKEEPKKIVELYPKKEVVVEKPKFKPTPVISPVYGILDKNYTMDEV